MHGGTVTGRSEGKGRGSEFEVRLPFAASSDNTPVIDPADLAIPPSASKRLRVLVVDDNQDAADLLSETLSLLGYPTRVAHDGPAALRIAEEFAPDVALLDIGLPVMDGYQLARRLREMRPLTNSKLVAVTGYGQEADRAQAKKAGFDAHFVKPLKMEQMTSLLKQYEAEDSSPTDGGA